MGKFLSDMIELGIEASLAIPSSKRKIEKVAEILQRLLSGEEIGIEEFINMYDTRIHNFKNKRDDIKIMKQNDFLGIYIIHNCTKNTFLVGKSKNVLRKVDRQFRGYENHDVYIDYESGDIFKIRIIKFEDSDFDSIDKLELEMKKKYGTYSSEKNINSFQKETKKRKNNDINVIFLLLGFLIIITFFCFLIA
jgi:hypothetical protein